MDEFEKENQPLEVNEGTKSEDALSNWYSYDSRTKRSGNALRTTVTCIGLVIMMALGFLLGVLTTNDMPEPPSVQDESTQIEMLSTVLDYLRDNYYFDVSEEEWQNAIANGGSALLQGAGDNYGYLYTPQGYYDRVNPKSFNKGTTYFGFSYQMIDGVGLIVSTVAADGSAFGVLEEGDIILKLTEVKNADGGPVVFREKSYTEFDISDFDTIEDAQEALAEVESATFQVLRSNAMTSINIKRGALGLDDNDYSFVEYYFGDEYCNISKGTPVNFAKTTTYALRELSNLEGTDIGYIRIDSFSDADAGNTFTEFKQVLQLFKRAGKKRLILDLKGNPGGDVSVVSKIAGLLCTDELLSAEEKALVKAGKKEDGKTSVKLGTGNLLVTSLDTRTTIENYFVSSSYNDYFDLPNGKRNIVVWTDGNSASASELLTGALLDYKTGFQIGTCTFGKGIAQSVTPLTKYTGTYTRLDGTTARGYWYLVYTVAKYYSPLGSNIHGVGYTPLSDFDGAKTYHDLWTKTLSYWGN